MNGQTPQPRFTLAVLTYNRVAPLDRCLASIRALTRSASIEVVVVDDGSSVSCKSVIERHSSGLPLRYHRVEENQGVSHARDTAIEMARGEFISFIADDYTLPADFLTTVADFFAAHPDAIVVTHNIKSVSRRIGSFIQNVYLQLALLQFFPLETINEPILQGRDVPAARAAVFRRSIFDEIGLFNRSLRVGEDGDMTARLAKRDIPIYFLADHYIRHHEKKGVVRLLRQRLAYGRSLYHAAERGYGSTSYRGLQFKDVGRLVRVKLRQWNPYAWQRRGFLPRYLLAYPGLVAFLFAFYWGLYTESRIVGQAVVAERNASERPSIPAGSGNPGTRGSADRP